MTNFAAFFPCTYGRLCVEHLEDLGTTLSGCKYDICITIALDFTS